MIDQSNITGRITCEHDVVTGKPIYLLFINDEFIKEYKTHSMAQSIMTRKLNKLYYDEVIKNSLNINWESIEV